jgi:hypothetical protein
MSQSSNYHGREQIHQPEIPIHIRQLELKLIFEDPPDIATSKDLLFDRHPANFKWWSGNPEPEEYV